MSAKVREYLNRPVWEGGRTLHVGEGLSILGIIAFTFFVARPLLKNIWFWVALIVCLIAMIIW